MRFTRVRVLSLLLMLVLAGCSHQARTENPSYGDGGYSDAQLDQMLAPIALYPDSLLSQILMAATYPREVEEAADWSARNPGLSGSAAVDAVDHMDWDPSVKALAAFPQVLDQMARDMDWTQRLGDAYLMQEAEVIDSIQRLRDRAYRAGQLDDVEHVRVIRDRGTYIIEPASISLVYVPYYSPLTVYGNWWWPDYPPYYWGPPRGYHSGISFYWGTGIAIAPVFFYSTFHWHNRHIVLVDRHHYYPYYFYRDGGYNRYRTARRWEHNVHHRRDVIYDPGIRDRYPSRYQSTRQREGGNPRDYRRWERRDGFGGRDGYRDGYRGSSRDERRDDHRGGDSNPNRDSSRDGQHYERRQDQAPSPGNPEQRRPESERRNQFPFRGDGGYRRYPYPGRDGGSRNPDATGTERRSGRPDPEDVRQQLRDTRGRSDSGERPQSDRSYRGAMEMQHEERQQQRSLQRDHQREMPRQREMTRERIDRERELPSAGFGQARPEVPPRASGFGSGEVREGSQRSTERSSYGSSGRTEMRERRDSGERHGGSERDQRPE